MPAAITHYLLAQEVLNRCITAKQSVLDMNAYLCGAQGPDFLLSHRRLPWQRGQSLLDIGRMIHSKSPSVFFEAMRSWLMNHENCQAIFSYSLGFLTHYAFDCTAHPYINSQAKLWLESHPEISEGQAHAHIETALDIILLRYLRGQAPPELPLKRIYPKLNDGETEIADMLSFTILKLSGIEVDKKKLIQAMKDFRLCQRLLNDSTLLKKPFVERLERLNRRRKFSPSVYIHPVFEGDEDFANILHYEWQNPYDESAQIHTEDFFELYNRALELSVKLIEGFLKSLKEPDIDLHSLTGELSYNTGIPICNDCI